MDTYNTFHPSELLCVPAACTDSSFPVCCSALYSSSSTVPLSPTSSCDLDPAAWLQPLVRLLTGTMPSPPRCPTQVERQFPQRRRRPVFSDCGLPFWRCASGMPLRRGDRVGLDAVALALLPLLYKYTVNVVFFVLVLLFTASALRISINLHNRCRATARHALARRSVYCLRCH